MVFKAKDRISRVLGSFASVTGPSNDRTTAHLTIVFPCVGGPWMGFRPMSSFRRVIVANDQ